ncbi:uncharacterized protein LOC112692057 isoform X2 [Sipha flava]|uniref:Uncharacterized protein LOC112692057 isoform X2 n=1 Tax=Sipha flava TaxID=143950 RepID=A0A8B8GGK8_9HEMI|nr:uncharacterized protein LOC112692057 isoform X2 [Sipha flava]
MPNSEVNTPNENNSAHCKTIFKQTFKFVKNIPEQRISPEGFLIRDCGCVMRFLPNLDNKLNKIKLQPTPVIKNQHIKNSSHIQNRKPLNQAKIMTKEMNNQKNIEKSMNLEDIECKKAYTQHTSLYQSTFWMEPRVVPIKYTTEVNFSSESSTKKFTETIDLQYT